MASTTFFFTAVKKDKPWSGQAANISFDVFNSSGTAVGSTINPTEIGTTGHYRAPVNLSTQDGGGAVADGEYVGIWQHDNRSKAFDIVKFLVEDEKLIASTTFDDVEAVKAKTDSLTFTVAGEVDANTLSVADSSVAGVNDFKADVSALALEASIDDVKGTGFVKDTHSLIDIEGFVDLIDDGTNGLAAIKGQANKIDGAATTAPSSVTTGSLMDRMMNKDGSKTFSPTTDSLEALRDNQGGGGGGGGATQYSMFAALNDLGSARKLTIIPLQDGQIVATSDLSMTLRRRVPTSAPETIITISAVAPNANNIYDFNINTVLVSGEVYSLDGVIEFGGIPKTLGIPIVRF